MMSLVRTQWQMGWEGRYEMRQVPARLSTWLDINHGIDHSIGMKWDPNINRKRSLHLNYMIFM